MFVEVMLLLAFIPEADRKDALELTLLEDGSRRAAETHVIIFDLELIALIPNRMPRLNTSLGPRNPGRISLILHQLITLGIGKTHLLIPNLTINTRLLLIITHRIDRHIKSTFQIHNNLIGKLLLQPLICCL